MQQKLKQIVEKMYGLATKVMGQIMQSWRIYAIGAVLIFGVSVGLLAYALYHPVRQETQTVSDEEMVVVTEEASGTYRLLDGVAVESASSTNLLPYTVMVENSMDAWPLYGPAKANLVIEAPVEGSITRFMLVFDPSTKASQIGPVRSARPYYVEWANGLGSLYAHVGGSPDALDLLRSSSPRVEDLNEFFNGKYFWRSESRIAPHNVFTSIDLLTRAASTTGASFEPFDSWSFSDEAPSSTAFLSDVVVPYQGAYRASWHFSSDSGEYVRSQNKKEQRDADGLVVSVKNVILIETSSSVLDDVGRLDVETTGKGSAILFRDGLVFRGTWSRSKGAWLHFQTEDGRDMMLARGKTWISVLTDRDAFEESMNEY